MTLRLEQLLDEERDVAGRKMTEALCCEGQKAQAIERMYDIWGSQGPSVSGYPVWHPLVSWYEHGGRPHNPAARKDVWGPLDHTVYFANAILTCPYTEQEADKIEESVPDGVIFVGRPEQAFYVYGTHPVLLTHEVETDDRGRIRAGEALPALVEHLKKVRAYANCAESWESVKDDILGTPNVEHHSAFVSERTGQLLRQQLELWNRAEVFGPLKGV